MNFMGDEAGGGVPRVRELGIINAIASWYECTQGTTDVRTALTNLAQSMGCEAVALSRLSRDAHSETRSVSADLLQSRAPLPRLGRSFARAVLGRYLDCTREGSIWLASMVDEDPDPALDEFQSRRRLAELAVIPLSVDERNLDFLELHFPRALDHAGHAILNMTAETLVRSWRNRKPGLMTEAILRSRPTEETVADRAPILSFENPARLSRAEFRVCMYLSRGYSNEGARRELGISRSTLRTHLRNIYQKTETSGQSELIYRLLQPVHQAATAVRNIA